jgi:integrase
MATLLATYRRLQQDADADAEWWCLARHVVEFALGTAMRRGEIVGLRWRDIELLDRLRAGGGPVPQNPIRVSSHRVELAGERPGWGSRPFLARKSGRAPFAPDAVGLYETFRGGGW